MSLPLLQTALLLPLQTLVNGVLGMDAAAAGRLARLEGTLVAVNCTMPPVQLFIRVRQGQLALSALCEEPPQASLHGSTKALLGLLLRAEPIHSLADTGVELRGSASAVRELQALLLDLDIDWEYHLARLTGDLPAALLGKTVTAGREAVARGAASARASVDDYLAYESGYFVSREALDSFGDAVRELSLRLDRLEARLALAQAKAGRR